MQGKKNGADIYSNRNGVYYADNGYDVRMVGRPGWKAHPLDIQRLRILLEKHAPAQTPFTSFILVTYLSKPDQVWNDMYGRFERPKEPKKPTFGKTIRKARWAKYDEEFAEWQQNAAKSDNEFRNECARWNERKREYNQTETVNSGKEILLVALGSKASLEPPPKHLFKIKVPPGKKPGDIIVVEAEGQKFPINIPQGVSAGQEIQFEIPLVSSAPHQNPPPDQQRPDAPVNVDAPPPAIQQNTSAPPPAIKPVTSFDGSL